MIGQIRHKASTFTHDCYWALSALRHKLTPALQFALDLASVSGRRISRQTVYIRLAETGLYSFLLIRYIRNFSKRAIPLTYLLRKDTPFEWPCETKAAFDDIKEAILNPPVLALPDPDI
ncbi:hypothetical protein TNCV_874121 [Trichonephila clavipes]|nr:hypothetical protein TNCV_874121 [Trichonephila clavipes]